MHVRSITLRHFMNHDETLVPLPPAGLVVVTGQNGAGKSTLVEGVAWGVWGKTLRGHKPWRAGGVPTCEVKLALADDLNVARTREGAKTELAWELVAGCINGDPGASSDAPEYPTATKAQHALEAMVGPFDLWRRSHVFSSADAAHFTLATDGERKRLIEAFLGSDRFDPALEACRVDLKAATAKVATLDRERAELALRLHSERRRLKEAKEGLARLGDTDVVPESPPGTATLETIDKLIAAAARDLATARAALRDTHGTVAVHEVEAQRARETLALLRGVSACPTCAQPVAPERVAHLENSMKHTAAHAKRDREKGAAKRAELEELVDELEGERKALTDRRAARAANLRLAAQARTHAEQQGRQRAALLRTLGESEEALYALDARGAHVVAVLELAEQDRAELAAVEQVLGLRGVRANILGTSLVGIEAVANVWLARLRQGLTIKLTPYAERGVGEAIGLEVVGAGGEDGYKGSSAGERRRLDVALLLALAEVASAARGTEAGTLWFDEVFDHLDEEGVAAVASAIVTLATPRAVVVITHSRILLEHLQGAKRLVLEHGIATWID